MARPKLVPHDDLTDFVHADYWQGLCAELHDFVIAYEVKNKSHMNTIDGVRAVMFALQVVALTDDCDTCDAIIWPHRVTDDGQCRYHCPDCDTYWHRSYPESVTHVADIEPHYWPRNR